MAIKEILTPIQLKEELKEQNLTAIAKKFGVSKQYITQMYAEYKARYPDLFAEPVITSQWLTEQLESRTILDVCNDTGKSYHHIKKLMREYGIEKPTVTANFDKDYIRQQYVTLCQSDKAIAMHYGCSVSLVRKFRYEHAILKSDRAPLMERLTAETASKLLQKGYAVEELSLRFDATPKEITRLLKYYKLQF